jgi:N-acyl-L-homoserine lactone synthetase
MFSSSRHYHATIFKGGESPLALLEQQKFRKSLFVTELGWNLKVTHGVERDEFDTSNAIYCSLHLNGQIVGCWRAIRACHDYLGKKLFPQLATERRYPSHPDFWEMSRLGVISHRERLVSSRYLYATMFHFARTRNAHAVGGVVTLAHNAHVVRLGVSTRSYGPPQVVGFDTFGQPIEVFFGDIPMIDQSGPRFEKLINLANEMEITDETLVLGRSPISA